MEFDIGTENAVFLAKEDHCLQVEPHLLLEPVPEALNNYIVDALDNPAYGESLGVNIWCKSIAEKL
jgi:hypothetical protein